MVTKLKYKFKKGDKVRIKPGSDLMRIAVAIKKGSMLTVVNSSKRPEGWGDKEFDILPTYAVDDGTGKYDNWNIPESFLKKV